MMLKLIELAGTPYEMGRQHGQQLKDQVRSLSQKRLRLALLRAKTAGATVSEERCRKLAHEHLSCHEQYFPEAVQEWQGIADGAEISLEEVFFANALTDFQDVLWRIGREEVHGCTVFAVGHTETENEAAYIGQTWDMHASAEMFITVFHRRPNDGPESITLSTAGCLTLVGINSAGIAVGNNNLRPIDARPGAIYLALLHRALAQTDLDAAVQSITETHRASGHNYILADEHGNRVNVEATATQFEVDRLSEPRYVHTNHYLSERLRPLEDPDMDRASTDYRLERLRQRFRSDSNGHLTPDRLQQLLADHDGGNELCICRHGTDEDARSCAFVVSDPKNRCLYAMLGPPCQGQMQEFSLS